MLADFVIVVYYLLIVYEVAFGDFQNMQSRYFENNEKAANSHMQIRFIA